MREIKYTTRFKRDYRREKSGQHGKKLDTLLMEVNVPPLDREEEMECIQHVRAGGRQAEKAGERLVEANLQLVVTIATCWIWFKRGTGAC